MYPMGTSDFQPFPKNVIYNIYAECDSLDYKSLLSKPFINTNEPNPNKLNCSISIVSPISTYKSEGDFHIIGDGNRQYKKLSWGMKLNDSFMGRNSVKLRALASDPTLIREKLSSELYNAVGVPIQESTYARLIINNDIYGLYLMVDVLSTQWIEAYIHGNSNENLGIPYLLNSNNNTTPPDLKYLGDDYEAYSIYKIDENGNYSFDITNKNAIYRQIKEFTKLYENWVNNYSNDTSETSIIVLEKFLNLELLLRMLVIDSLILAIDNFWLNGTNTALYYNPNNKVYQFLPYDFDTTFMGSKGIYKLDPNNYINDCETWTNFNETGGIDHYFTKNLFKHPLIKNRYEVILAKASRKTFAPDTIAAYIHSVADMIDEDVQWNFDAINNLNISFHGKKNKYTYDDFKNNLEYGHVQGNEDTVDFGIKEWVEQRGNRCSSFTDNIDISIIENGIRTNYHIDKNYIILYTFLCILLVIPFI